MKAIKKPIVIVGCGFAGVNAALNLRKINKNISILVVDSNSKFVFKPLLYEVLSDEIKSWEVAPNFENIFSKAGISFLQNRLISINFKGKILKFDDNLEVIFEHLILCTGSKYNTFSIQGVDEYCYFFNDIYDQNRLKNYLEKSTQDSTCNEIFIIGAGPSGVELACKLYDMYNDVYKISIIEKDQEILNKNKIFNREEAEKALNKRDINLRLNSNVKEINEKNIVVETCEKFPITLNHHAVIWTAGVKSNLPIIEDDIRLYKGRILVNNKLQMMDFKDIYVLGDIAVIQGDEDLPITAQVAMQQGKHAAKNLSLLINKQDQLPFNFNDNGEMISLGIGEASISGLGITLSGKFAFDLRRLIYASKMPNFEKGLKSTVSWVLDKKSKFSKIFLKD